MKPRTRWFPYHGRIRIPLGTGFIALLALLLTASPARAQVWPTNNCFMIEFGEEVVRVTAGTDPTWPSYEFGPSGWAVPGGRATLKVKLANHTVVGSVRTFIYQAGVPNVGWPVGVETTERTQGFQADWTVVGNQLQVHLYSTSGAVIEPGFGPIYRVVYQVNSDVGEWDPSFAYSDTPDVIKQLGFMFVRPNGTEDRFGSSSVVLDPHGAAMPWCGTEVLALGKSGGIAIINPAAVFETPLFVTGMAPSAGAFGGLAAWNVDVNANVSASFSEAVLPATVNGSTMTLTRAGGSDAVSGTVTLSGLTATLNPNAPLQYGTTYIARITQGVQDLAGNPLYSWFGWSFTTSSTPTAVEEPAPPVAPSVTASPNPFGGETSIAYGLPTGAHASVRIYSASGRLIRTLADSDMPAGVHLARWDGRDAAGAPVSSGIYFLQFATSGVTKTQRLMLLR